MTPLPAPPTPPALPIKSVLSFWKQSSVYLNTQHEVVPASEEIVPKVDEIKDCGCYFCFIGRRIAK